MDNPVPFILTGDDGTSLAVDPKAKEALSKIKKPVVVVSVVGMYRTGKSFLLNRLMNRTDGFPLGSTVEAKTKGIWMWVGDVPCDPTRALVLLDTEGLHDPEKGDKTHDVQIFTLAVLLSSVLIYNSKGTIDANSLDGLHLATELTNHISFKVDSEEETGDDFSKFFPMLVWAVRDHHLELKVNGEEISANQYLENCLALKKGRSAQVIQYNGLRETIRAFFQNRQCFVFPPPCSMDSLKNLDHMRLDELDHAFIRAGDAFTDFVAGQAPSKVIRGKAITGSMWSTLAEQYVNALLTGNVNIESAYDSMIRMENTKSVMSAIDSYKTEMNKLPLPQDSEALNAANTKAHTTATEIFLKTAVNSEKNQEYSDNMNKELSEIFNSLVERNQKVSEEKCAQLLNRLYQAIGDKVARGTFTRPGGHLAYKEEVERMEREYAGVPDQEKGPCGHASLLLFRREKIDPQLSSLLQTDQALTEQDRRQEVLKREVENRQQVQKMLEEKNLELARQQEEIKKNHEVNLKKQKEEFDIQYRREMAALEENMRKDSEEKARLLEEGFKERAALMQDTLDSTTREMQEREERAKAEQAEMQKNYEKQLERMAEQQEKTAREMSQIAKEAQNAKDDGLFGLVGKALDIVIPFVPGPLGKLGDLVSNLGKR